MPKGQDAVLRKKNKINRKGMRRSDSAVSTRIASIVAFKRRRLASKRRSCEGMCFTLPTPDDPFNDRLDAEPLPKKKAKKPPPLKKPNKTDPKAAPLAGKSKKVGGGDTLSKFFILCLKGIQATWEEEGSTGGGIGPPLMTSQWVAEFCRRCCTGMSVMDTSGACASNEQVAWLVSMCADKIAIKEKQGLSFSNPFLIYLVPSQEKAIQVKSATVSLHPGAALDHQVCGLKSCEPEFLVSTLERLLELVSVGAVGISGASLLVIDGLKDFVGSGFQDKVKSIRESISGDTQIVIFGDCFGKEYAALVQNLFRGPTYRLSLSLVRAHSYPNMCTFACRRKKNCSRPCKFSVKHQITRQL